MPGNLECRLHSTCCWAMSGPTAHAQHDTHHCRCCGARFSPGYIQLHLRRDGITPSLMPQAGALELGNHLSDIYAPIPACAEALACPEPSPQGFLDLRAMNYGCAASRHAYHMATSTLPLCSPRRRPAVQLPAHMPHSSLCQFKSCTR